jgi:hypothetical protein
MSPQLNVHSAAPPEFLPALAEISRPQRRESDMFKLAPAMETKVPLPGFFRRIDWTAVGAAAFVYAVAFTAWLYLAK